MKRFIVFVVVFVLALGLFGALAQPTSVSAQINCNILADTTSFPAPGRYYRVVNSASPSQVLGGPIFVSGPFTGNVYVPLNGPFTGQVRTEHSPNAGFSPLTITYDFVNTNCQGNNAEVSAPCDKLGFDVGLYRDVVPMGTANSTTYTLNIFKNGNPFSTETITINGAVGPLTTTPAVVIFEKVINTTPLNPSDVYTYQVICGPGNNCPNAGGGVVSNGAVLKSGTLERKCDSPCGPSQEGKPLGLMTASVPFHWAPQAGAASTFIAEAGKTFKVLRTSGDFTEVVLACKAYWVPSSAIQIIGN
jgi:hypothetical protein